MPNVEGEEERATRRFKEKASRTRKLAFLAR
jgi:hypothetical protein